MSSVPGIEQISVRTPDRRLRDGGGLAAVFGPGPWLVLAPHDDDAAIGMGCVIAAGVAAGIEIHIAAITNGRMGWWSTADRDGLVETRKREMVASSEQLGVPAARVHFLGFPDGSLGLHQGCRPDDEGPSMGRSLVRLMRRVRPSTVFSNTGADLHPDHRITRVEADMACCWASSKIWQEYGEPIAQPARWDYAVYCDFPEEPHVEVLADAACFERKISSMDAYVSQDVIEELKKRIRDDGPYEYFQQVTWQPYRPSRYRALFAKSEVS